MNKNFIRYGFIIAGVVNVLGSLLFTKFFTNDLLSSLQPGVLSDFGFIMIILWGLAYIAVSQDYENVKWLVVVFALEKLAYVIFWVKWISTNDVLQVIEQDILTGVFYAIYGPNDFIFGVFFAAVAVSLIKK